MTRTHKGQTPPAAPPGYTWNAIRPGLWKLKPNSSDTAMATELAGREQARHDGTGTEWEQPSAASVEHFLKLLSGIPKTWRCTSCGTEWPVEAVKLPDGGYRAVYVGMDHPGCEASGCPY
jgi:hypothetical protein